MAEQPRTGELLRRQDARTLEFLRPIIAKLWGIFNDYVTGTNGRDIPWGYNECSLTAFLAAAAFSTGDYLANAELCLTTEESDAKGKSHGRGDLWLYEPHSRRELYIEAKRNGGHWDRVSNGGHFPA